MLIFYQAFQTTFELQAGLRVIVTLTTVVKPISTPICSTAEAATDCAHCLTQLQFASRAFASWFRVKQVSMPGAVRKGALLSQACMTRRSAFAISLHAGTQHVCVLSLGTHPPAFSDSSLLL